MYFHTTYKYEKNIKVAKSIYDVTKLAAIDTTAPVEWNFLKIKGKVIYLVNSLALNKLIIAGMEKGMQKST